MTGERNSSAPTIVTGAFKVIIFQSMITLILCAYFYFSDNPLTWVASTFFGGCMAMMNTWIMHRGVQNAAVIASYAPGKETMAFYAGVVKRFVFTVIFFVAAISWLKLPPAPLVLGFGLAQLAFFVTNPPRQPNEASSMDNVPRNPGS